MEKFPKVDMDAATTGVDSEDPDYYDIEDVKWAMRVTNSGEFLHAAPWSAASHGRANVSHGCTGMSTANASWLYQNSRRGDVVKFINSPRGMEDQNGWTDWNVSWDDWKAGSALSS
jgi:lipoprotein-anchoring transpeptidase ErfK/SrfK